MRAGHCRRRIGDGMGRRRIGAGTAGDGRRALPASRGLWARGTAGVAWAVGAGRCRRRAGYGRGAHCLRRRVGHCRRRAGDACRPLAASHGPLPCSTGDARGPLPTSPGRCAGGAADVAWALACRPADAREPLPTSPVRRHLPASAGGRPRLWTRRPTLEVHATSRETSRCDVVVGRGTGLGKSLRLENAPEGTENLRSRHRASDEST